MIVPTTHGVVLLLAILSMICWGAWAATYKAGKLRFELYYYDFAMGVMLIALVAAFTVGTFGEEMSFSDNFLIAGKLKMVGGFASGLLINLAGMLLLAAVSVSGLSVAFPMSFGVALVTSSIWRAVTTQHGVSLAWFCGLILVDVAIVLDAMAWGVDAPRHKPKFEDASPPPGRGVPKVRPSRPTGTKGILLSIFSGLLFGAFFPLASWAQVGDNGLGPYSLMFLLSLGVFISTLVYNVYFMNLPVQGQVLTIAGYFRVSRVQHLLGLLGGVIWSVGALSCLLLASVPANIQPGRLGYGLFWAAPFVSVLLGLNVWREFRGAGAGAQRLMIAMLLFYAGGVVLVSWAM